MLRVKEAVKQAQEYLPELFFEPSRPIADVRLEEVELSEDQKLWSVTFSYLAADSSRPITFRDYKTIRIRSNDGEFVGLRNGMLASA